MAVTSLKFLTPFRRPKNAEISKRSSGAPAIQDYFNNHFMIWGQILMSTESLYNIDHNGLPSTSDPGILM